MKLCSKCGVQKPLEGFHKRYDRKCSYRAMCKECHNKSMRNVNKKSRLRFLMKKKVVVTHQICSKCGQKKDINKFHKNINRKTGYNYSCKKCFMKVTKKARDSRHRKRMQNDITYKYN